MIFGQKPKKWQLSGNMIVFNYIRFKFVNDLGDPTKDPELSHLNVPKPFNKRRDMEGQIWSFESNLRYLSRLQGACLPSYGGSIVQLKVLERLAL